MKLRWSALSLEDRQRTFTYIARDNPHAANLVDARILRHARRLLQFPRLGRIGRIADTRELTVPDTSHVLVYRELPGAIRILRVIHTAQQWPESAE